MYPPIFSVCAANAGVQTSLGVSPTRLYPSGEAPSGVALPYAVWQMVTGIPQNYLGKAPDIDSFTVQIDVFAATATEARNAAEALRDAIEPNAHITAWRGESRDAETRNYRYSFDLDWFVPRA